MMVRVVIDGQEYDAFEVIAGVKLGCVLEPAICNLFLVREVYFYATEQQHTLTIVT